MIIKNGTAEAPDIPGVGVEFDGLILNSYGMGKDSNDNKHREPQLLKSILPERLDDEE